MLWCVAWLVFGNCGSDNTVFSSTFLYFLVICAVANTCQWITSLLPTWANSQSFLSHYHTQYILCRGDVWYSNPKFRTDYATLQQNGYASVTAFEPAQGITCCVVQLNFTPWKLMYRRPQLFSLLVILNFALLHNTARQWWSELDLLLLLMLTETSEFYCKESLHQCKHNACFIYLARWCCGCSL